MKTYHILDKYESNVNSELEHYTFEELKNFFKPQDDFSELLEEWEKITDLEELESYLKLEADGMEVDYIIQEDEVESLEAMNRANEFFKNAK